MQQQLRLVRMPEVQRRVGLGKTKIYGLIKDGEFPPPLKRGRSSLWRDDEIDNWILGTSQSRVFEDLL